MSNKAAIRIALAGNPNSGKTTMFNDLTGSNQYVGNWPGVTVEKKEGKLKNHKDVFITDLPGIYSLSPYTLDEVVSRDFLLKDKPDAIINLVDATNIERNLYLTTQIMELGIPTVIALNMMDIVNKNGDKIDIKKLESELGCAIIETSALKGTGSLEAAEKAIGLVNTNVKTVPHHKFSFTTEKVLGEISRIIKELIPPEKLRWYSIKVFERDNKVLEELKLSDILINQINSLIASLEIELDDDAESIITNERYEYIVKVIKKCVIKIKREFTTTDKIDRIITNRWLALPIFAFIMFGVYYISVSWLGTIVTDWTNDTLFGEYIIGNTSVWLENIGAAGWLIGLIVDGIIGGVGSILGFVPQMFILFFFLSIFEDCGYMARVAFIMDRIFRKFGLSGKSFIPLLIASGCGVPGIMAAKTIENEKDRRMTIMTTTFVPCGAKLPVIALIGGVMFPKIWFIAPAVYFLGIFAVAISGIMLKKTRMFAGGTAPFIMELPQYHMPAAKNVLLHVWDRGKAFIIKAGTVIFIAAGTIWFLSSFGFSNGHFGLVENNESLLASIGNFIAPLFSPLGFGNWQASVATLSGLLAKENIVATLGVLFGISGSTESDPNLWIVLTQVFGSASAASFLVFNMLCAPCVAAIATIKREMASTKWTWFALLYQTGLAYTLSFITYQIIGLITGEIKYGTSSVIAVGVISFMLYMIFRPNPYKKNVK
ncbi:MAG: ferrous iron transport protein B [Clostridiales bacterium GWF2_36_10]|nr:MAG: ferrous iron transport protein B [Clostridiales bacterium GWF2_36_10]HAN20149.1 ferrous iron transport protein B [Clostridiales bacterium]